MMSQTGAETSSAIEASEKSITRLNEYCRTDQPVTRTRGATARTRSAGTLRTYPLSSMNVRKTAILGRPPRLGTVVRDDLVQDVLQVHARLVADERANAGEVGDAPAHVLEALLVGAVVRHERHRRRAVRQLLDQLRELR